MPRPHPAGEQREYPDNERDEDCTEEGEDPSAGVERVPVEAGGGEQHQRERAERGQGAPGERAERGRGAVDAVRAERAVEG